MAFKFGESKGLMLMRKIAIVTPVQAEELRRRLEENSIRSFETPEGIGGAFESPEGTLPISHVTVWVAEEDSERARGIADDCISALDRRTLGMICRDCGYDLRAHNKKGNCPECGVAFELPEAVEQIVCARCREDVPADFDVCWNCGSETGNNARES